MSCEIPIISGGMGHGHHGIGIGPSGIRRTAFLFPRAA